MTKAELKRKVWEHLNGYLHASSAEEVFTDVDINGLTPAALDKLYTAMAEVQEELLRKANAGGQS